MKEHYDEPPDESPQRAHDLARLLLKLLVNVKANSTLSFTALCMAMHQLCVAMGKTKQEMRSTFNILTKHLPDSTEDLQRRVENLPNFPHHIQQARHDLPRASQYRNVRDNKSNTIEITL